MIYYVQRTGNVYDGTKLIGSCYSGNDLDPKNPGLNNPAAEDIENHGPIPAGLYTLTMPFTHPRAGAFTMRLKPDASNTMHDRDGFMWHGDNAMMNHTASDGCIVGAHFIRVNVNAECGASRKVRVVHDQKDYLNLVNTNRPMAAMVVNQASDKHA
jgi:hypothetical protein